MKHSAFVFSRLRSLLHGEDFVGVPLDLAPTELTSTRHRPSCAWARGRVGRAGSAGVKCRQGAGLQGRYRDLAPAGAR